MTDTAISNSALNMERPLEKWMPEEEDIDNSLTLDTGKKQPVWDQFKENERKFGVKTDFNMDDYTTKLDKNSKDYKKKEAQAERLAREIEKVCNINMFLTMLL